MAVRGLYTPRHQRQTHRFEHRYSGPKVSSIVGLVPYNETMYPQHVNSCRTQKMLVSEYAPARFFSKARIVTRSHVSADSPIRKMRDEKVLMFVDN